MVSHLRATPQSGVYMIHEVRGYMSLKGGQCVAVYCSLLPYSLVCCSVHAVRGNMSLQGGQCVAVY